MSTGDRSSVEWERLAIAAVMKGADVRQLRADYFVDPITSRLFAASERISIRREEINTISLLQEVNDGEGSRSAVSIHDLVAIDELVATTAHFSTILAGLNGNLVARTKERLAVGLKEWTPEQIVSEANALAVLASGGGRSRLRELLDARRFDATAAPPKSWPIFRIGAATIASPGNLLVVASQAKAGKSALVGALMAASTGFSGDTLGISSENPNAHAVIHFDTEQSAFDHHALVLTAFRRVGGQVPGWLRSYRLVDVSIDDRFAALEAELHEARREHGGIHSALIDGVADMVRDPNDSEEAFAAVARLHELAVTFNTTIACILHFNPSSEGKARGHLGSQLERKAETNLHLEKDENGVTVVFSTKARHATIAKKDGPRFRWSSEDEMHVSVADLKTQRQEEHAEALRYLVEEVFTDGRRFRYGDLLAAIKTTAKCSDRTADTRFSELRKHGLIRKVPPGLYEPTT